MTISSRALKGFLLAFLLILAGGFISLTVSGPLSQVFTVQAVQASTPAFGPAGFFYLEIFFVGLATVVFGLLVGVISFFL
ncbi:MAG TPA: hypothetical protein VKY19_11605 [Ktedonosporobacter sp.]|jgi:hypothetical protein|nr:hypothetical protein [Ktedonosporobacter sp.]